MQAWIAGFTGANPDATVNYDPSGSGAGRTQFVAGGVAFAGSDAYLKRGRAHAGPAALRGHRGRGPGLHLPDRGDLQPAGRHRPAAAPGHDRRHLRRQDHQLERPEIAADNPGKTLPDQAITPVHRSDESGTTENFTDYLSQAAERCGPHEPDGAWPIQGGEAAQGTSGVVGASRAATAPSATPTTARPAASARSLVKVGDEYVGPTPEAAANVLDRVHRVEGRGDTSFAFDLARDTTAAGTYPIVLVSYQMACTKYAGPGQADLVKGFLTYTTSAEGQEAAPRPPDRRR